MRHAGVQRTALYMALGMAAASILSACTGGSDSDGAGPRPKPPTKVKAALTDEGSHDPGLAVSFRRVEGADAYLLRLGIDRQPIRVVPKDCGKTTCSVALGRLTTVGAEAVTVQAVAGGQTSKRSQAVELPAWPEPEPRPTALPDDEPVTLIVTREGDNGKPVIDTVTVPAGKDVKARIKKLRRSDDVLGVGVDVPAQLSQAPSGSKVPKGSGTWQREALNFAALPDSRGKGVTIAVIDAYLDESHPSFEDADITTTALDPGVPEGERVTHATGVTSLIVGGRTGRVPGIAYGAKILGYDVINQDSFLPSTKPVAEAIIQAVDDGADIINMSLSFECTWLSQRDLGCPEEIFGPAIAYAEEQGVVVVASAGNDGDKRCTGDDPLNQNRWPAKFDTVISVGATERDGSTFDCSADKPYVDVLAPGADLLVAEVPDTYERSSGTSYSAPLVAGLIANVLAERPNLSPYTIRLLLRGSLDRNKRVITSAFLLAAGILPTDRPHLDPTTLRRVVPFAAMITFPKDSDVWHQAVNAYDNTPGSTNFFWDKHTFDNFPIKIAGTLLVSKSGKVQGFGFVKAFAARYTVGEGATIGHAVDCPVGGHEYVFRFDMPVYVQGQLGPGETSSQRLADLSISLGRGSNAEHPGRLGKEIVVKDEFDRCGAEYRRYDIIVVNGGAPPPWGEVKTWPERNVKLFRALYATIIDSTPVRIEDAFFSSSGGGAVHVDNGTYGDIRWELRVGSSDLEQL